VEPGYIAIFRNLFDTGIEALVLTILIGILKVLHNTNAYIARRQRQPDSSIINELAADCTAMLAAAILCS